MADFENKITNRIRTEDETKKGTRTAKRNMAELKTSVRELAKAVGAGVALKQFTNFTQELAQMGDDLQKTGIRTGAAVETLSQFGFAVRITGSDLFAVRTGIRRLSQAMFDAQNDSTILKKSFQQLGVAFEEEDGQLRAVDQVLLDLADSVKHMDERTRSAAIAQKLLGRSGDLMIPFLDLGREGIQELADEADRLNFTWSELEANIAADVTDAVTRMEFAFDGLRRELFVALSPAILQVTDDLKELLSQTSRWIDQNPTLASSLTKVTGAMLGTAGLVGALRLTLTIMNPLTAAVLGLAGAWAFLEIQSQLVVNKIQQQVKNQADAIIKEHDREVDAIKMAMDAREGALREGFEKEAAIRAEERRKRQEEAMRAGGSGLTGGLAMGAAIPVDQAAVQEEAEQLVEAELRPYKLAIEILEREAEELAKQQEAARRMLRETFGRGRDIFAAPAGVGGLGEAIGQTILFAGEQGPPLNAWQQWAVGVKKLFADVETDADDTAQKLEQNFAQPIIGMFDALISKTQDLGEAFKNLGMAILNFAISSLIPVFGSVISGVAGSVIGGAGGGGTGAASNGIYQASVPGAPGVEVLNRPTGTLAGAVTAINVEHLYDSPDQAAALARFISRAQAWNERGLAY